MTRWEWHLVLEHGFVWDPLKEEIEQACALEDPATVRLSATDLEDLIAEIAGAANHARSRRLMLELDEVVEILESYEERFH